MSLKEILLKKRELKIKKSIYFKSYMTGLFFSILIMLIPTLIIVNLTIFYHLIVFIHFLVALDIIFFIFFLLYFKNKALEVYVIGYKEIDHKKLLAITIIPLAIIILTITFVIVRLFRWW